jgi:hypothetical protein
MSESGRMISGVAVTVALSPDVLAAFVAGVGVSVESDGSVASVSLLLQETSRVADKAKAAAKKYVFIFKK